MYNSKIDEYKDSIKAKAVVIDELVGSGRKGGTYYYPQYRFSYLDSEYVNADRHASLARFDIGDSLVVIFRKNNPSDAIAFNFIPYWIPLPTLLLGVLLSLILPSIAFVFDQYLQFRKEQQTHKL